MTFTIARIEASILELPLVRPFIVSFGTVRNTSSIVLKVYDTQGACGIGEMSAITMPVYKPEYTKGIWAVLNDVILPFLSGKSFAHPRDAEQALTFIRGHYFAKAAVSTALYDLYSRQRDESIIKTLAGTRMNLTVSRTISLYDDPARTLEEGQRYYDEGIRWIKLKIAPGRELKQVRTLVEHFPDAKIMVDANAGYEYNDDTIRIYQEMDEMGLFCFEQPLRWNDIVFHSKLQEQLRAPIALDESLDDVTVLRQALVIKSCRAANIKISRVGGFGEAIKIEEEARSAGMPVWVGGMMESPVGFHANLAFAARDGCSWPLDFLDSTILVDGFFDCFESNLYKINGDTIHLNAAAPGFGFSLNEKAIARYTGISSVHEAPTSTRAA